MLYLMRAIPLIFPNFWLKKIENVFLEFIWSYSKPRRSFKFLTLPRECGGLALPNLRLYYWATCLVHYTIILRDHPGGETQRCPSLYELLIGADAWGCLWRRLDLGYYKRVRFKTLLTAFQTWAPIRRLLGLEKYFFLYSTPG